MAVASTVLFRATRPFKLRGEQVVAGQTVDMTGVDPHRALQLEAAGWGVRVSPAETPAAKKTPARRRTTKKKVRADA